MRVHVERTGQAVRKQDQGRRVTMCGRQIGGIGIDDHYVVDSYRNSRMWVCRECRWIEEHYEKRKTFVRDTEVMCQKQKQQGIKPQLLGGPACEDSEL